MLLLTCLHGRDNQPFHCRCPEHDTACYATHGNRQGLPLQSHITERSKPTVQGCGSSLFMAPSAGRQQGEKLVPIAQDGSFGAASTGDTGRDDSGKMHATADIPTDSQAIIHTHPAGQDPLPSGEDYATATKIGKPNFVMTKDAIYVAMPGGDVGHPVKVADISQGKHGQLNIKWNQ